MLKDKRAIKIIAIILLALSVFTSSIALAEQTSEPENTEIKTVKQTLEVKRGDYIERSGMSNATVDYLRSDTLGISNNNGIFVEYLVPNGQEVKKDDKLISYQIPVDSITVEEMKMNFANSEKAYFNTLDQMEAAIADSKNRLLDLDINSVEAEILQINIQKQEIDYMRYKKQTQKALEDMKSEIDKLESDMELQYVYAPYDGVVFWFEEIKEGTNINRNTRLLTIFDPNSAVLVAPASASDKFWYNMDVSIGLIINRKEDKSKLYKGKIIAADSLLNGKVSSDKYYIQVEDGKDILQFGQNANVYAEAIKIEDVIVIPLSAVNNDNERRFVYILDKDGIARKQYITGRDNGVDMWVYNGLDEGMQIVIE